MTVRWGIAGPGRIAEAVAGDFGHVPGAELVAVGSRSAARAADFAGRHDIARAHGSYRALLDDPEVDVVYIATPHPQHHALALAAIEAGKGLLIEKAFTATVAGAQEIVAASRERGVFVMEAMWTRFQPALRQMRAWLDAGVLGDVRAVEADLGVVRTFDPADRLFAPELGGGALLDLGVYVVSFAQWVLGTPERVVAHGRLGQTGVEEDASVLLTYPDGVTALLTTSLHSPMPGSARVFGTEGWIDVLPRFHHPTEVVLHRHGAPPEHVLALPDGGGYSHELAEVTACVEAGAIESAIMPLADTLVVQQILADAGQQLGVEWREDPTAL
ncbi:Gfo/Idh/MocA family oxidoreductase [Jatrophihabitans sp.]|uniref:Gfo/Idh/MocA family protein n=1 Tax=Jatrophihabitans sp. TaxID=1932789 RepID=UPI0030C6743A